MPRALLVAHHYPPHIGGLGIVVQNQAQSLAASGYQVLVVTSKYGAQSHDEGSYADLQVIRIACSHVLESRFGIVFPLFSPRLVCELWRQVKRADVVHVHDVFYMSSWLAGLFSFLARRPMLLTQHVGMVEHSSRIVMFVQRLVYGTIGQWLFCKSRRIVVYNENVRAFLRSRGVPDARILLMANGIDTAKFCPPTPAERWRIRDRFGLPEGRRLVLFVGRLVEKKGYRILLAARDPAYDLVFAGPGAIPREGRVPGVHWVGPLDQTETRELYRACDLFAFPAVGEIFTLVMQEAMACGLPVVTTNDPAYVGSMAAGTVMLCPREAGALKTAILGLLADTDRLLALSARSRELALRHFDWRANFSRLLDAYGAILRRRA
jgi:glycosyltransferase involved in cell wall biosynthesis